MRGLPIVAALLLGSSTAGAQEAARPISLAEVLKLAQERAVRLKVAEKEVEAAEQRVASARGYLFPRLRTEGNILVWNEETAVSFAPPGTPPELAPPPVVVRDQVTASLSVTLAQPLTGLYAAGKLVGLENRGLEAAEASRAGTELDETHGAVQIFFRALQARGMRDTAARSVAQFEAQLTRARALEEGGVLSRVDLLRLESGLQAARQGLFAAETGLANAERGLALALDLPKERLAPRDEFPENPPPPDFDVAAVVKRAVAERPELVAAQKRLEQASAGRAIALAGLVPNILAIATYQHTEGQAFQEPDTFFAGLTMTWDVWDWGVTWNQADEAKVRAEQAELALGALDDALAFEAERAVLDARTVYESLGAAKAGLAAAEEAHRIQNERFEQGEATTTDVLDAEADLSRARNYYLSARYSYFISLSAVSRAIGAAANASLLPAAGSQPGGSR